MEWVSDKTTGGYEILTSEAAAAKEITGKLKSVGDRYAIWASTRDVDRDGEVIEPSAFKNLQFYLKNNPVILFGHNYNAPPIGKATDGRIWEDGLQLDIEFAPTDFAQEIKTLYDGGYMNSFSVGFIPKDWKIDTKGMTTFTDVELMEVSAVPVPANAAANMIRQAKSKGIHLDAFEKFVLGADDTPEPEGETEERKLTETERIKARWK